MTAELFDETTLQRLRVIATLSGEGSCKRCKGKGGWGTPSHHEICYRCLGCGIELGDEPAEELVEMLNTAYRHNVKSLGLIAPEGWQDNENGRPYDAKSWRSR